MKLIDSFNDLSCRVWDGPDNIVWVESEATQVFPRRSGKAVQLNTRYRAAVNNASNLAGFIESDLVGATGGHPASLAAGDKIPVNFGHGKTCVFPTSNRVATELDLGKQFAILVAANVQYVDMNTTHPGVLTVTEVVDEPGHYAACRITAGREYGQL